MSGEWQVASGKWQVVRGKMCMVLRVKEKNEEAQLSIDRKRGQTINLYLKEREGKLHGDCQSRSAKLSTSAEPSSPVDTRRWWRRRENDELSVDPKRRKTMDLYTQEREGKLTAGCQRRSPMPSPSAKPSSSPSGQARPMGAASQRAKSLGNTWWLENGKMSLHEWVYSVLNRPVRRLGTVAPSDIMAGRTERH